MSEPTSYNPGYGQVDRDYGRRLATTTATEDGPVWMVNLMAYKPVASYTEGNQDAVSGRKADDRYAPVDILADIGAEVVLHGDVERQLLGDLPRWDRVGVVRYPTRRSFIEMQTRPDFQAKHVHKEAGMATTIVMVTVPAPLPSVGLGQLLAWDAVEHPPTPSDGPVVVVHVIRYAEGSGRDDMAAYQAQATVAARGRGARIGGWFDVEGTIIGDGRRWDQVRFNVFPSLAAFMAVVADPARLEAQRAHREPAMQDTYTLVVRPQINRLDGMPQPGGRPWA